MISHEQEETLMVKTSFWDKIADFYDFAQLFNRSVNRQMTLAVESEIPKGALVLDCASGTGALSAAAAKNARHVRCTDCSKPMLIRSMKKAERLGIKNISFAKRDILSLKDPDCTYDAVIAGNVLHLLDDPEKAFSELVRVTKKGGKIIIPTYLQKEGGLFGILICLYRLMGFSSRKSFNIDEYLNFIAENAEANGCAEYSTRLLYGALPAGFSVITK